MTTHDNYHTSRKHAALPRWEQAWKLRRSGLKLREVAAALNVSLDTAFKCIEKYNSHRLK